jgi:hypothetical protein
MRALLLALAAAALLFAQPNPRVGFYQWESPIRGVLLPSPLFTAPELIQKSGAGLFRIYVGPRFDYFEPVLSPRRFAGVVHCTPLDILRLSHYKYVIEHPSLVTIVLTVYPARDYGGGCDDIHLSRTGIRGELDAEYRQMSDLAEFLLRDYGHLAKTVILANTEADNRMIEIMTHTGSSELAIRNMIAWQNTRFRAVDQVRRRYPKARLKLLNAFEIALVNLAIERQGHRFVKSPRGRWNALRDVVPRVSFDLLSYSAYESTNAPFETGAIDTPPAATGQRLERDLARIGRATPKPVMIGELGIPGDVYDKLPSGGVEPRLISAVDAIRRMRVAYVVFWQVYDAPAGRGEPVEFGWLDPQRRVSRALLDFIRSYR